MTSAIVPSIDKFWAFPTQDACVGLACTDKGLSNEEARIRLIHFGINTFKSNPRSSAFILFLSQFKNPITILLVVASLLSLTLGDYTDSFIIVVIILVSSCLGFWQENGAARAVVALLKMVQIRCCIVREGTASEFAVEQVVPGDIIIVSAGDVIPGDSLIIESKELYIDEAAFTGETFPVEKFSGVVAVDTPLSKRSNSLFMGSHVISGKGRALVIKTGKETEFGKVADRLRIKSPETEFEKGIRQFGYVLMEITLILVISIFAINIMLHKPVMESLLFSLALAVGLTPQLLPAIISVNLSVGARAMAKHQVIVKRLSSIENIGSMNILCTDKTGTITEGKATVKDALNLDGSHSDKVHQYAWLNAVMQQGFENPIDEAIRSSYENKPVNFQVQSEVPYDFIRKRLSVQVSDGKENIAITKGAFNEILSICTMAEEADGKIVPIKDHLDAIQAVYEKVSLAGYRVLGLAYKNPVKEKNFNREDEKNMIFLGFISLNDPPKKEVQQTIQKLLALGVRLKIITGDNALVAESLAKQIGIEHPVIISGAQMQNMSDRALFQQAVHVDIFAEVEPNQKEHIILFLKKSGNVVGFMGDGINDAPALHAADVGISVDSAVDVAKEAADIVLLTKDLSVLSEGIVAGRKTFTNTMKYIFMATSANFGTMFSMAGASLFLPFLPMLPKQILMNNLLTDLPEMTIATDRVDSKTVDKPHRWDIRFIKRFMIVFGLLSSVFDYLTFAVLFFFTHSDAKTFQTGWFMESVISQTLVVLVVRTRLPFFKSLPGRYLGLATGIILLFVLLFPLLPFYSLLGFVPMPLSFYGWMILIVLLYIMSTELAKKCFYMGRKPVSLLSRSEQ